MLDQDPKFAGISRLYGAAALPILQRAHILVIGIGGVGCWTAEALARTGIGSMTLIDPDDICVSNSNRQLHAMSNTLGRPKVAVIAERLKLIAPEMTVHAKQCFFNDKNAAAILDGTPFDAVIDAVDIVRIKCLIIRESRYRKLTVITVGGAGGRTDPSKVTTGDLRTSINDPLLSQVRKKLRQNDNFPGPNRRMRVPCVFSPEDIRYPHSDGSVCDRAASDVSLRLGGCESGYGAATFVTGTFGFAAAELAIRKILRKGGVE